MHVGATLADKPLPKLTTTSFALLGLLRRQPWSAYELTQFMRNSVLRAVWPRAESHLYSEPKLLLKRGFVEARREANGARKRTVYTITDAGNAALDEWLSQQEASRFRFEYELLVRLAFADSLDLSAAQRMLAQARQEAIEDCEEALRAVRGMLQNREELGESSAAPYSGALIYLMIDQLAARLRWADELLVQLQDEPEDRPLRTELGPEIYDQAEARLLALLDQYR